MTIESGPDPLDSANAADIAEQHAELVYGASDGEPDQDDRSDLPLEANPADVAEQERAVPYDDER